MIILPKNHLILNWHRIFNTNQLFEFLSKKFKQQINSEPDITNLLKWYDNLNISIRHSDTFLKDESETTHNRIIQLLSSLGTVKQTWKKK
jgi:hypothetical protein